jgi:NADH:ubiquinone oxidoreductase subunit F (NADH-binding)
MEKSNARRDKVLELFEEYGGLNPDATSKIAAETGVPEADIYGVGSFYTLVARPNVDARVCQGLSCSMFGIDGIIEDLEKQGLSYEKVSCLGQCDRGPVAVDKELELIISKERGGVTPDNPELPMNLGGVDTANYTALKKAREISPEALIASLKESGLQGRGGAGFPIYFKLDSIRSQKEQERYVVINADEGEPGTFKDREVMLRRPHKMLEGLAIAALTINAKKAFIYIRGEFSGPRRSVDKAIKEAAEHLSWLDIEVVAGHGAYICGEETALLEALEGRRGMPRLKPPFPTQMGLWGKPTLINNVETLACIPAIVERGGAWFKDQGLTEAGSKLYCISGHIQKPGVYELPLGITLEDLVQAAGGYVGNPKAFSPGGASSGFLKMEHRGYPLDFKGLGKIGSMLGSAGAVVLNDTINMARAAMWQQVFFEDESCGQCAPCRIGCTLQKQSLERYIDSEDSKQLNHVEDIHWEMEQGSICGLGMVASLPLQTAMKYFPQDFGLKQGDCHDV